MPPTLPSLPSFRLSSSATLLTAFLFLLAPGSVLAQAATPAPTETSSLAKMAPVPGHHPATAEEILQKYLQAGGPPGASYIEQKAFLKAKGLMDPDDVGFVRVFQGSVTFARNRKSSTVKVTGAEPVLFLDFDETGFDSRIEMQFDDGSILAMGENSGLKIDEMIFDPKTAKRKVTISVPVGTIRIKASKNLNADSAFEIRTPLLVAGLRGTELIIQVDETGRTRVTTLEGAVAVRHYKPGEARPAPKIGGAELSSLGAAAANEVMVVAGMMTEALPGRIDALRTRIAQAQEIRAAIQATVVKPMPAGAEKKAEQALPPGLAKKQAPGELPPGFAKKDDGGTTPPDLAKKDTGKEIPPGLANQNRAAQASPSSTGQGTIRREVGGDNGTGNQNPGNSRPVILSRGAVPVALTGTARLNAQKLLNENVRDIQRAAPRMVNQETRSLAKETTDETTKALARASARETGRAISRAVIQESVTSAVKESVLRSAKEQASTAVKQAAQEAAASSAKQAAVQAAQESGKQAAQEAASSSAKQAAVQAAQESGKQAAQESGKQAAAQAAQQAAVQAARESGKQAAQEAVTAAVKEQVNNSAQNNKTNSTSAEVKEKATTAAKENTNNAGGNQGKGKDK